jgi:hypothetical protein
MVAHSHMEDAGNTFSGDIMQSVGQLDTQHGGT